MRSTEVIGTRLPRSDADALKRQAAEANTSAGAVIRAALDALKTPAVRAAVAQLPPKIRSTLAPIMALEVVGQAPAKAPASARRESAGDQVEAIDIEGRPGTFSPATAALLNDPTHRRSELAYRARHRAARANNRMPTASDPVDVSYLSPEERAQYQAALAGRVGGPAVAATPARKAPPTTSAPAPAKPRPAQPAATRESLRQHLGLSAKAHGGGIRRVAKNVATGLPGMRSTPEHAAALRAHLGLPRTASDDQVMSIVWSLTTPPGAAENPYQKRLAGK